LNRRFLLLVLAIILFSGDILLDFSFNFTEPILLPNEAAKMNITINLGANESGENVLLVDVIYDANKGWNYVNYSAFLNNTPIAFVVSENDLEVSGKLKHRIAFSNFSVPSPNITQPDTLSLEVNLSTPDVSYSVYPFDVVVMWAFPNNSIIKSKSMNITVSKPELYVSDIKVSKRNPIEGENITVYANISNSGGRAGNVKIVFKVDGAVKGNITKIFGAGTTSEVNFAWKAVKGSHTLEIFVDPDDNIREVNETNNKAGLAVSVAAAFGSAFTGGVSAAGGTAYTPEAVLLANSIDLALAGDLVEYLRELGIRLHVVSAANFSAYSKKRYVIILGGHKAYEGVGEIVASLTTPEERERILAGRVKLEKPSAFAPEQRVFILAGKDRYETANAWRENYVDIAEMIRYGR